MDLKGKRPSWKTSERNYLKLIIVISFRPPFDKMIESIKEDIAQINRNTNTDKTNSALAISDVDNPSNISTYSNNENFF